jgi:catechol 2,3-dioxygenase-like lactoylglutathione lyase family enzyme
LCAAFGTHCIILIYTGTDMDIRSASMTLVTPALEETRHFYETHFNARPVFDCGWYVVLRLGTTDSDVELCIMLPQDGMTTFTGGVCLNLRVSDADSVHERLHRTAGLPVEIPLEDHPWGDRGFGLKDPAGTMIYCYHPIAPDESFQRFILDDSQ